MRQLGKSSLSGWRGNQIWTDEMLQTDSPLNAASILYVIVEAHAAVKRQKVGNTPRQRKRWAKLTNRFKLHLEVKYHALRIGAHDRRY